MKTITINASRDYNVVIGSGILATIGARIRQLGYTQQVCIVSDTNVFPLYGSIVRSSLEASGLQVNCFVFLAGEERKNGGTYLDLINHLAAHQLTRTDCIVALGGGVVGDLAGFAAATYLRGISYIQIPTTLLAAVDSSVGGKTAIDLPTGKNLCGAFYQPSLVLCDTDTLDTLTDEVFRDGCAEVIKYAVLFDRNLFQHLSEHGIAFAREEVIARCVELKRDVVIADEFDTGVRMKLNLGHTLGHGVEKQSAFSITHGKAVAIGMSIVSRSAAKMQLCSCQTAEKVLSLIRSFGLPTDTPYSAQILFDNALSDKKRSGGTVNLIVPRTIGQCDILPTPIGELKSFIEAGL